MAKAFIKLSDGQFFCVDSVVFGTVDSDGKTVIGLDHSGEPALLCTDVDLKTVSDAVFGSEKNNDDDDDFHFKNLY
jgi:hypothetical protein